jgi:hypothetical protein
MIENTLKPKDKVKINLEAFAWQVDSLTPKFLKYINDNADTVFTLKKYGVNGILWEFEEDPTYLFWFGNLTKIT